MAENAVDDSRVPICHLSSEPVPIEGAKTDEAGRTVHEACYVANIIERSRGGSIRRLRVVDWISTVPAIGACTACAERFTVPVVALSRAMAQANLQYQFDHHKCKRSDVS